MDTRYLLLILIAAVSVSLGCFTLIYIAADPPLYKNNFMQEFLQKILGPENTVIGFLANFFFAGVGVAVFVLGQAVTRNPDSSRTPFKFSWSFLAYDNAKRLLYNTLLIFVYIRFCKQLTGLDVDERISFFIGFGLDGLMAFLKKANVLDKNKTVKTFTEQKAAEKE